MTEVVNDDGTTTTYGLHVSLNDAIRLMFKFDAQPWTVVLVIAAQQSRSNA